MLHAPAYLIIPPLITRIVLGEGYAYSLYCPSVRRISSYKVSSFNPLNAELNPICYLLALLGAHHFLTLAG